VESRYRNLNLPYHALIDLNLVLLHDPCNFVAAWSRGLEYYIFHTLLDPITRSFIHSFTDITRSDIVAISVIMNARSYASPRHYVSILPTQMLLMYTWIEVTRRVFSAATNKVHAPPAHSLPLTHNEHSLLTTTIQHTHSFSLAHTQYLSYPHWNVPAIREDFDEAIRLKPTYAHSYIMRGFQFRCLEQFERALQDYAKALELDPTNAVAFFDTAFVHARLNHIEDGTLVRLLVRERVCWRSRERLYRTALTNYSEAIRLDPTQCMAYNNRALQYCKLNRHAEGTIPIHDARACYVVLTCRSRALARFLAIRDYTEAIRLNPAYASAYNNRGLSYSRINEHDAAGSLSGLVE